MKTIESKHIQALLCVGDFEPEQVLNPVSISGTDRALLTRELEAMGIRRLSVEHATHRQTLKKVGDEWQITCSNAKY